MNKDLEKITTYLALCSIEEMCKTNVFGNEDIFKLLKENKNLVLEKADDIIPKFTDNKEAIDYFVNLTTELLKSLSESEDND